MLSTGIDRIRAVCCSALCRRPTFRPPTTCEHKSHTSTALATGGDGRTSKARTAAAAQRPPAAVVRVLSPTWRNPGVCSGFGAGGGLSFADCWALCVELGLVREPHQSGRAARRRWGREKAVGDGGGPHSSIQNGPSPRPSAAENVACWGLSCVTPLARRVKVAPVCDQPQPRQAPPGRCLLYTSDAADDP